MLDAAKNEFAVILLFDAVVQRPWKAKNSEGRRSHSLSSRDTQWRAQTQIRCLSSPKGTMRRHLVLFALSLHCLRVRTMHRPLLVSLFDLLFSAHLKQIHRRLERTMKRKDATANVF